MSRQAFFPGTEPPAHNADVELAIERWYEARAAQREAADVTAIRAASVLEAMTDAGIDVYPFAEPETGKRKVLDASAVRRARVKRAVSEKQEQADREFDAGSVAPAGPKLTVAVNGGEAVDVDAAALRTAGAKAGKRKSTVTITGSVARGAGKGG
jgi:hypothetical protein